MSDDELRSGATTDTAIETDTSLSLDPPPPPSSPPSSPPPSLPPLPPSPPHLSESDDVVPQPRRPNNYERRQIAATTISAIDDGFYEFDGQIYNLRDTVDSMIEDTSYYPPESELEGWSSPSVPEGSTSKPVEPEVVLVQCSTLEGCHRLHEVLSVLGEEVDKRIGVLNFASAKKPGGGFLNGAQAQEETIARSSTLYASLMIDTAQEFYALHHECPKDGYYTHAMIYSPRVQLCRYDSGEWHAPIEIDVLTSPAVNAGVVRRELRNIGSDDESGIEAAMKERMARLLYLFEKRGVKNLVLGSFGTGVFRNKVEIVAKLWVELLLAEGSRFKHSFERVLFAIIDGSTVAKFERVFNGEEVVSEDEGKVSEDEGGEVKVRDEAKLSEGEGGTVKAGDVVKASEEGGGVKIEDEAKVSGQGDSDLEVVDGSSLDEFVLVETENEETETKPVDVQGALPSPVSATDKAEPKL